MRNHWDNDDSVQQQYYCFHGNMHIDWNKSFKKCIHIQLILKQWINLIYKSPSFKLFFRTFKFLLYLILCFLRYFINNFFLSSSINRRHRKFIIIYFHNSNLNSIFSYITVSLMFNAQLINKCINQFSYFIHSQPVYIYKFNSKSIFIQLQFILIIRIGHIKVKYLKLYCHCISQLFSFKLFFK